MPSALRTLLLARRTLAGVSTASIARTTAQKQFDPLEADYGAPNTRLGRAGVVIWHNADHYGQMIVYLRLNGIVPPASRPNSPVKSRIRSQRFPIRQFHVPDADTIEFTVFHRKHA